MIKYFITLFIAFSAVPAVSCPQLSGNFDCTAETGPVNSFTISTTTEKGQVVYYINGTKLIANGTPETRRRGDAFPTTYTTSCEGQTLRARIQTQVSSSICPSLPLSIDSISLFTPVGNQIEMDDITIALCPDKAPMNVRHKFICTKK
ncbi:hypothetical protein [Bdellovibrio bacteriovorus]|uniref:Uncharacterized protein n=1 Tax=Bdellovibrio bacteriovorus str. Tiberius TaxID=1069642 RepID=K7Z957_BDEBC|nr:hypothetical protein [Bdellovibrio bacteriovorus]AFY01039.1 Hypothetical protein Bdt_1341 [Bdellovibrio bacteriovorus str. Tiberius]